MRVLIIRPEREATALATALSERGHAPVIAPFFRLEFLHPPSDFSASLAACQTVLLSSANGARALAEASEQRGRPILAVGDTTASTAEGLGFSAVTSANGDGEALADLVRQRLDPKDGPLLYISGREVAFDLGAALAPAGFEVKRIALYDAREETALPESARAALEARALDVATFFSPRSASVFASMVEDAGLAAALRGVTAVGISEAALAPVAGLPFKAAVAAARPTRQAVLDEIDRLAEAGVQGPATMSDAPADSTSSSPPASPPAPMPPAVRRGPGALGAFLIGVVAAVIVLAGAVVSLPFWPEDIRAMWRGRGVAPGPMTAGVDLQAVRADAAAVANAAIDAARRDLVARLDELDKRLGALSAAANQRPAADPTGGPAIAELRSKVEALAKQVAEPPAASPQQAQPAGPPSPQAVDADKEIANLRREIAVLQTAQKALNTALDQAVAGQRDESAKQREQTKALAEAVGVRGTADKQALALARASAVIGVAARLSAALDSGRPFAGDLDLLAPLIQGDGKLSEIVNGLTPYAQAGVASRTALRSEFPNVARATMAEDLADDSFGERLLGKVKGIVSLRRVGDDVQGDSVEAKLARAEAALAADDLAKAVELMKSMPAQTNKATSSWLTRAQAHLAAKRAVDQLSAYAVTLLGATR
jgi:uroporphyrinogen-III synthase